MKRRWMIALLLALMVPFLGCVSQVFAADTAFTAASLDGTYKIACACEGTTADGTPVHTGGTGTAIFDGDGKVTLTQQNVYVQQNGVFNRLVADGYMINPDTGLVMTDMPAEMQGTYSVDADGFGKIVWDGQSADECDPEITPNAKCPSLMIAAASGTDATSVYMIIPNGVPNVLIHVTATKLAP